MTTGVRQVRLGRIWFTSVLEETAEVLGDVLQTVGAGVLPGERRARQYQVQLPVRGAMGDSDPYVAGERLRRQVRSLMENTRAKLEGLFYRFLIDEEQNGWLVVGGGQIAPGQGGVTMADWKLSLEDAYRVATLNSHRPARRIDLRDRRLATTPRDILGTIFSTDYAAYGAVPLVALPVGATDIVGQAGVVTPGYRHSLGGDIPVLTNPTQGDVVSYEQPVASMGGWDDVVAWDRRGRSDPLPPLPVQVLQDAPRGYWRLGDTPGSSVAADVSRYRNDGAYVGLPSLGVPGLARDGTTAAGLSEADGMYVRVPDDPSLRLVGSLTIAAWVRLKDATAGYEAIASKHAPGAGNGGYRLGVNRATGQLRFEISADGTASTTYDSTLIGLTPGVAAFVAAVYDATAHTISFYRDGVMREQFTGLPASIYANTRKLNIGRWDAEA